MIWFYESIRIPALNERISVRDDRIKELEGSVEKEKWISQKSSTALDQCTNEITLLSSKLHQIQDDYARLVERQALNAIKAATDSSGLVVSNDLDQLVGINWKQAVFAIGDQEDISFFMVDRVITELRFTAADKFHAEMETFTSNLPRAKNLTQTEVLKFFTTLGLNIGHYIGFRINLEELRVFMTKFILTHYREEMIKAHGKPLDAYYSGIRERPEMLASLAELGETLQAIDNSVGWNSNASYSVRAFMKSNQVTSASPQKAK